MCSQQTQTSHTITKKSPFGELFLLKQIHYASLMPIWLFRKKRPLGNFSIEQSFTVLGDQWPHETKPLWIEANDFSEGWRNRWNIIRQTGGLETNILHITGDIHFAALAWPRWKRNRPKVVLTIHDIGFIRNHHGWRRWVLKKIWITWPLRCVDQLITVSEATRKAVLQEAPWFDSAKVSVIATAIPQHFQPRKTQPKNPIPVALHIGLAENKNLRRHAEALKGLDVHLRIIGEPSTQDRQMLEEFGIEYSTRSELTDAEMQEAYATSDFLLFASTLEGFGMPILEAQMVGIPVITSDLTPMSKVAGDGGLFVHPKSISSIRKGIEQLLGNHSLQQELIEKGFKNQSSFCPKQTALQLNALYEDLLTKKK
jgi:glycosyltransferase involved in cell wall biosynthesis